MERENLFGKNVPDNVWDLRAYLNTNLPISVALLNLFLLSIAF
ncbi:MAG: hypothetical protein NTY33_04760 [Candidatus Moranbacteria bacterium]|nr:hypothetical protein [Candidatus Moranbacteria bacterium]